ncbi:MAG: hypothetical protein JRI55_41055, partial [Deltaproteobacteria bacterium]|nr:hypothetical protein [Deltaproteobacteria bacterium]
MTAERPSSRLRARGSALLPHALTMLLVGIVGATLALTRATPGGLSGEDSAARAVGEIYGLYVIPGTVVWSAGPPEKDLGAATSWHEVLFLAAQGKGEPGDLYRAEARIRADGGIAALSGLRNLTNSPKGDDFWLSAAPPHLAVATRSIGQVRSLTIFDLEPTGQPRTGEGWSPVTRLLARLTDLGETGRSAGVGRTTVRFAHPPDSVSLGFTDDGQALSVSWDDRRGRAHVALVDPHDGHADDAGLVAQAQVRLPKRPILWLVDTVRSWSWVGPGPIEWAEGRFFGMRDALRRLSYRLGGEEDADDVAGEAGSAEIAPLPALDLPPGHEIGAQLLEEVWPPAPLSPPVFAKLRTGEGQWRPGAPELVKTLPNAP